MSSLWGQKTPSTQEELQAKYQCLTLKERGFVNDLNALALGETSVEALCSKRRQQMGTRDYAQWIHEFNAFARRWPHQV